MGKLLGEKIYGMFGVEMRAYGQKLVKFCTQTHRRVSFSSIEYTIGLYRENAIAVRVIDRSAYDATSRVHAHRQRKNMSYLRNGCCIYYLRPTGSAHL